MSDGPGSGERTTSKTKYLVVGALLSALVVGPLVVGAYALGSRSAVSAAADAMVGAGIMRTYPDGFRPNIAVSRIEEAIALQRAVPRLAIRTNLDDLPTGVATDMGIVTLKIDGAPHKTQGVLISVQMQLDHDNALGSGCNANFTLTAGASPSVIGSWSHELYAGTTGQEDNIAFTMFVKQVTHSNVAYHLNGTQSCGQTLFADRGMMTAQSFPLTGGGTAVPAGASVTADSSTPAHDR